MSKFKSILADEIVQSFKDKRIIAVIIIYLIILSWGMKKAAGFSALWGIWLTGGFGIDKQIPFPIIFFYFASIGLLPIFSLLLSYDVISGERKVIRNLVYRAKRMEIFFAKFLAIFIINIIANLVMYIAAIDIISSQQRESYLGEGMMLYAFLACFALYFTSLSTLSSTITKTTKKSLFLGALLVFIPLVMLLNEKLKIISPFHYYKYGIKLFTEQFTIWPFALLIISAAVFLGIAYIIFKRQDL